jgi:hypothetical protein
MLRVLGDSFQPREFLKGTGLMPCSVFVKGDTSESRRRPSQTSGFNCAVSSDSASFEKQVEDALAFFKANSTDLERLHLRKDIESMYLDFAYECRLDDEVVAVQREYLPVELLRRAGELGLGIALTHLPSRQEEGAKVNGIEAGKGDKSDY